MKHSRRWVGGMIFTAAAAAMVAAPAFVSPLRGQDAPPAGPSLSDDMRGMAQAFGKIRAQYKDPTQNDSTLAYLTAFETHVVAAKSQIPPTIAAMPDADRQKATDDYRLKLRNVVRAALDLEDQLAAGDMDKAAADVTTMQDIEKAGHAAYRPKRGG
jgi:hypothetical protein